MLSIALNESLKMTNLESALFFTYLKDFRIANNSAEKTLEYLVSRTLYAIAFATYAHPVLSFILLPSV